MSYAYDVMASVFQNEIAPKIDDYDLRYRFEVLINEMHEANHRLNDGINKDAHVGRAAHKLDKYVSERRTQKAAAENPLERKADGDEQA